MVVSETKVKIQVGLSQGRNCVHSSVGRQRMSAVESPYPGLSFALEDLNSTWVSAASPARK